MAATVAAAYPIDLSASRSYNVRPGDSITDPRKVAKFASIRYNHVPTLSAPYDHQCSINLSKDVKASNLRLNDGEKEYIYDGNHREAKGTYALMYTGREFVLERVIEQHAYNLTSTPDKQGSKRLREQYSQISLDDEVGGDLSDLGVVEDAADPSNPYDYRNFLKPSTAIPKHSEPKAPPKTAAKPSKAAGSTIGTSAAKAKRPDQPLFNQRKRQAVSTSVKPNPKRIKAGEEENSSSTPTSSRLKPAKADAPRIRLDRKASVRKTSYDDSGELILENEPVEDKLPTSRNAMALALSGQLGQGPISLRSAASSPASRATSPLLDRPLGMEEDGDAEFLVESPTSLQRDADADEEGDHADVEGSAQPSPVDGRGPIQIAAPAPVADEEDDLDKQLAEALGEADGDAETAPTKQGEPESEESEEE